VEEDVDRLEFRTVSALLFAIMASLRLQTLLVRFRFMELHLSLQARSTRTLSGSRTYFGTAMDSLASLFLSLDASMNLRDPISVSNDSVMMGKSVEYRIEMYLLTASILLSS